MICGGRLLGSVEMGWLGNDAEKHAEETKPAVTIRTPLVDVREVGANQELE